MAIMKIGIREVAGYINLPSNFGVAVSTIRYKDSVVATRTNSLSLFLHHSKFPCKNYLRSNFFIKLKSWEYWPFGIIQAPIIFLWFWYAIKERSLLYFSASNPSILTGGMMGESKFEILQHVSDSIKPKTILVRLPSTRQEVVDLLKKTVFPSGDL
jgi:hypothetical protein